MITNTYFIVRWLNPRNGKLQTSTMQDRPTREEAEEQFQRDVGYFYDDVGIEFVEVTETVTKTGRGTHPRPGTLKKTA